MTIHTLQTMRAAKVPISMLTAYDYPTALSCSSNPAIDITLVGDSLAQVCLGYKSTTQLTLDEMIHHARAVARGTTHPLLVADMPFGSYHGSLDDAVNNAVRMVRESQIEAVKLEGGDEIVDLVHRLTSAGIPVMAHVGLLPQRHVSFSGYKVQGKSVASAKAMVKTSKLLEQAGAFSMVVEAVPKELGRYITENVTIPTIGIGAGPWTNGQVRVLRCRTCFHPTVCSGACVGRCDGHMARPQGKICTEVCQPADRSGDGSTELRQCRQGRLVPRPATRELHHRQSRVCALFGGHGEGMRVTEKDDSIYVICYESVRIF